MRAGLWRIVKLIFLRKPDSAPEKGIRSYRASTLIFLFFLLKNNSFYVFTPFYFFYFYHFLPFFTISHDFFTLFTVYKKKEEMMVRMEAV